jgi:(S)-2-hydroxy-acid oxidase
LGTESGFRRCTNIIKALALGARGACIGRPYLFERVLEILRAETGAAMQQVGAPAIKDLTPAIVQSA